MKKVPYLILTGLIITVFLSGCQLATLAKREYPTKVVSPQAPYLDENIEVIDGHVKQKIDRTAQVSSKAARFPLRFWDKFKKGVCGVSEENPYDRSAPYYRKDFQKEMLAEEVRGVTQPQYLRGERYAKAYRAPFIFREEMKRGGTSDMQSVSEIEGSLLAKQYLDFQKDLEDDLDRAEKYLKDGKYAQALKLVDNVMDLDSSSNRGRLLFEKIIRAREAERQKHETTMREKIANDEKIAQYIYEAQNVLEKNNYDEALRIAKKAISIDPQHEKARELIDSIELAMFENNLSASGTSSLEVLERMIYKHLTLYQQYANENLIDLAEGEIRKVDILESYRDRIMGMNEYSDSIK